MMIKAVLFDLDGTLIDSVIQLGYSLNLMLEKRNLPKLSLDKIRPYCNQGGVGIVKLGFNFLDDKKDKKELNLLIAEYYKLYYEYCDKDLVLFPGIDEVITYLHKNNYKWGIITNKITYFTEKVVEKLPLAIKPDIVVCGDTTSESKPSIKPMLYATSKINIAPENCIYIGDAKRDIEAGNKANMKTIVAKWGYLTKDDDINSWEADYIFNQPLDVLSLIK